jgi:hypothetical protein
MTIRLLYEGKRDVVNTHRGRSYVHWLLDSYARRARIVYEPATGMARLSVRRAIMTREWRELLRWEWRAWLEPAAARGLAYKAFTKHDELVADALVTPVREARQKEIRKWSTR